MLYPDGLKTAYLKSDDSKHDLMCWESNTYELLPIRWFKNEFETQLLMNVCMKKWLIMITSVKLVSHHIMYWQNILTLFGVKLNKENSK